MYGMGEEGEARAGSGLSMVHVRSRLVPSLHAPAATPAHPAEPVPSGVSRAAVAAVLRDLGRGPEVLLIRRAERARDPWSGHMAFPGGREDPEDPSLFHTAVRETHEEVALDLTRHGRLLGSLATVPAMARGRPVGLTIAPYVFELIEDVPLALQPDEVTEWLWAPVEPMLRGERRGSVRYELSGQALTLPAFDIDGRMVWGLTYRMLESLFALLR
jgi:8-oxo-dGTP pyrophosphatase MutT (NUDIX family)